MHISWRRETIAVSIFECDAYVLMAVMSRLISLLCISSPSFSSPNSVISQLQLSLMPTKSPLWICGQRILQALRSATYSPYHLDCTLEAFSDSVNSLRFDSHGRYLAAGGDEGRVLVFDLTSRPVGESKPNYVLNLVSTAPVTCLKWRGSCLYVGYAKGGIYKYDIATHKVIVLRRAW